MIDDETAALLIELDELVGVWMGEQQAPRSVQRRFSTWQQAAMAMISSR